MSWSGRSWIALLAATACQRDFSLPPALARPQIRSLSPATSFAGERVVIEGERLGGEAFGVPRVTFRNGAARVLEVRAERLVVEVPQDAGYGRIRVQTNAGADSSTEIFDFMGAGHLRRDPALTRTALSPPFLIQTMAADGAEQRVAVAFGNSSELGALVDRASGEVTTLAGEELYGVTATPDGRLWTVERGGLREIGGSATIALPGAGRRISFAPDGTWACLVSEEPAGVGLISLPSVQRTGFAEVDAATVLADLDEMALAALPGPPRACLLYYFKNVSGGVDSHLLLFQESSDGFALTRTWPFENALLGRHFLVDGDGSVLFARSIFNGTGSFIERLDPATGELRSLEMPAISNPSDLAPGLSAGHFFVLSSDPNMVLEVAHPSLELVGRFSLPGELDEIRLLPRGQELLVADNAPLGVVFVDPRSRAVLGRRDIRMRVTGIIPDPILGQAFTVEGSPSILIYPHGLGGESIFNQGFPGVVERAAASLSGEIFYAAVVRTAGGRSLVARHPSRPGWGRLEKRLDSRCEGLAVGVCYAPQPCPFGPEGKLFATLADEDALLIATVQDIRDAATDAAWFEVVRPGLHQPGAAHASTFLPLLAVAEGASPPAVALLDPAGALLARAPLEGSAGPVVDLRFLGRARSVAALAGGRPWRIDFPEGAAPAARAFDPPWPAQAMAVSPDGEEMYLASSAASAIAVLDLRSGEWRSLPAPAGVSALALDGRGETLLGIRSDSAALFTLE